MSNLADDPFFGPAPDTLPLKSAPLASVLVQVNFTEVFNIANQAYIANFQDRIRSDYPISQQDQGITMQMTQTGPQPTAVPNWRFIDADKHWRVTLTTNFFSLESREYTSRPDFVERVYKIATALNDTIAPNLVTRIGVRYINRVYGEAYQNIDNLIRQEVLGIGTQNYRSHLETAISHVVCRTKEGRMSARWGLLPENQTHDPNVMPAISQPSWFLDTDVFKDYTRPETLSPEAIKGQTMSLATRAYAFFRWAVDDEFLRLHGG